MSLDYKQYLIDVAKSTRPGIFCFLPFSRDAHDHPGAVSVLAHFGPRPPADEAVIVGLIFTGSPAALARWEDENEQWLRDLTFGKA